VVGAALMPLRLRTTSMPNAKLNDIQFILLVTANRRAAGNLLPWPRSLGNHADDIPAAVTSLLGRKLIEEVEVANSRYARRSKGGKRWGLIITEAGRTLVQAETGSEGGSQPPSPQVVPPPEAVSADDGFSAVRCGTKLALVIKMLSRKNGVTIAELMAATGWLPHTTRATLSGLRKKGHSIATDKTNDVTRYRMAGAVQS
jgi:hypothetical protein